MISNHPGKDYAILENRYKILREKEKHLKIINDFAIQLIQQDTVHDIVWTIAKRVIARMGFLDCVVYLVDDSTNLLIQMAAHGPKNPEKLDILNPITIPQGEGIVGTVALTGKAELITDTSKDPRYILDDHYRLSEIAVPIIYNKRVIGVIDSEHPEKGFYNNSHLDTLTTIAAIAASRLAHAQSMEELKAHKMKLEELVNIKTTELKNSISRLARSNKDLEQFAYAASHDLKEPLRTIISYLQLLARNEPDLKEESRMFMDFVLDGSKRMNELLDGLMAYSRLSGASEYGQVVNTDDTLKVVQYNLNQAIQEKDVLIHIPSLPLIQGNKTQVLQLFQNLISNAIKFTAEGKQPVVELSVTQEGGRAIFKIIDNGIGISKEFHERIFKLFSRLNTIDKYKGSGIGLALCKRIVLNHGGNLSIESNIGQGSTFTFDFALVQ